jgi:hypothetical protein
MKKSYRLRVLVRLLLEKFVTVILGCVCLILIAHYWPSDTNAQPKSSISAKMTIVFFNGEKIVFEKPDFSLVAVRSLIA